MTSEGTSPWLEYLNAVLVDPYRSSTKVVTAYPGMLYLVVRDGLQHGQTGEIADFLELREKGDLPYIQSTINSCEGCCASPIASTRGVVGNGSEANSSDGPPIRVNRGRRVTGETALQCKFSSGSALSGQRAGIGSVENCVSIAQRSDLSSPPETRRAVLPDHLIGRLCPSNVQLRGEGVPSFPP
ncbi:hypothetical protein R1flu_021713 [Riccia fluitans]|uniref:Uncharacterized protein n=1 Tax=Riccia fluitans TaxID=41844 RepID=A0ABD1ZRS9_9MARC